MCLFLFIEQVVSFFKKAASSLYPENLVSGEDLSRSFCIFTL
jgi:hypothetical protein